MRILVFLKRFWQPAARRNRAENALDNELRAYVDLLALEHERAGMAPDVARRRALIETGGVEQVKEATRDAWAGARISNLARELRFTLRALRKAPLFAGISVAILAIGIGGATAIFTVIKGSLLQPLPGVSRPSDLVSMEPTKGDQLLYDFSYLDYRDLRDETRVLEGLAGYDGTSMILDDGLGPRRSTWTSFVTGNFFAVLGTTPALGRLINPADEIAEGPVVVLAYDLWQTRYRGDPRVVGTTIKLGTQQMTVIGVAQPRFIGAMLMHPMEMWIPLTALPPSSAPGLLDSHADTYLRLVGRLTRGTTVDNAQREATVLATRLASSYAADRGHGIKVFSGAGMTDEERVALAHLVALVIADGMRIATVGAVVGIGAGFAAFRVLQSQFAGVAVADVRLAGVATLMLCVTLVVACYVPARRASRSDPAMTLRGD